MREQTVYLLNKDGGSVIFGLKEEVATRLYSGYFFCRQQYTAQGVPLATILSSSTCDLDYNGAR